jgi:hypothetical protein
MMMRLLTKFLGNKIASMIIVMTGMSIQQYYSIKDFSPIHHRRLIHTSGDPSLPIVAPPCKTGV